MLCGSDPGPVDPNQIAASIIDRTRISRTAGAIPVNPAETAARALTSQIRRVVIQSPSVVIDVGRSQRLFTGSSRLAAMLQNSRCYWHGCWTPATQCQIDHLTPHREGGPTNPHNGLPACKSHNLIKETGYHTRRNPDHTWTITRPDGTTIPTHTTHWQESADPL